MDHVDGQDEEKRLKTSCITNKLHYYNKLFIYFFKYVNIYEYVLVRLYFFKIYQKITSSSGDKVRLLV